MSWSIDHWNVCTTPGLNQSCMHLRFSPKSDSLICKQRQKNSSQVQSLYKKVLLRLQIGLYKTCLNKQQLLKHIKLIPVTNGLVYLSVTEKIKNLLWRKVIQICFNFYTGATK